MRRFLPALLLLFAPLAFAQNQTIVTGTITDPSGIPYYPATVSACLTPATLYPMVAGQQVNNNPGSNYCFGPVSTASNGSFLMSLWGNALITCSPACPSTQWLFTVVIPGPVAPVGFGPQQFTATITISGNSQDIGATLNAAGVSQLRPAGAATNATNLVGPGTITGSFSGTHTETGNVTFTGLTQIKNIEGVRIVDNTNSQGWSGADACAWITSAQTALPSNGGTILAYGLSQTCAGGFTIGSSTKPVSLYLLGLTNLTVNASLIVGGQSSHIYGLSGMGASGATTILQGASFPASTPVIQIGTSVLITLATVEGVLVNCQDAANSIAFEALFAADQSGFMNDVAQNFTKYGFWYEGTGGTGNVQLAIGGNLWALSSTAVGTANSYYFHNGNNIRLTGLTGASNATTAEANQFVFDGGSYRATDLHVEWGTQGVQIGPVAATIIELDNITGSANVPTMVKIENIAGNRATLRHLIANGSATSLTDALVSGLSITDTFIPEYDVWNTSAYWRKANGTTAVIGTAAQVLGPDGTLGAPGFAFNSQTNQNTGWSKPANNYWKFSSNGLDSLTLGPSGPFLGNIGVYAMNTGDSFSGTTDTGLSRVAAGIVGVGNGTNGSFSGSLKLTGLTIAGTLLPNTAGGTDLGSTALPLGNFWLGTAATNNFKFQPASTTGARIITMADPLSPTTVALPMTIASGTSAMTTALIATVACGTTVTTAATGVLTTDVIDWSVNTAVTAANNGLLILKAWPTSGNVNFTYCNPGAGSVTPTAMTVNWSVRRP